MSASGDLQSAHHGPLPNRPFCRGSGCPKIFPWRQGIRPLLACIPVPTEPNSPDAAEPNVAPHGNVSPKIGLQKLSLAAPISAIEVRSTSAAIPAGWSELQPQDLAMWNNLLRGTDASLYQFPFWNEPYRRMWVTPRYLVWGSEHRPIAFATVLTVGFRPAQDRACFSRTGANLAGIPLCSKVRLSRVCLIGPARTATCSFASRTRIRRSWPARRRRTFLGFRRFPLFPGLSVVAGLLVQQYDCEEETLAILIARRAARFAAAPNPDTYFTRTILPAALQKSWPLYLDCANRKHFRLERPLSVLCGSCASRSLTIAPAFTPLLSMDKLSAARWLSRSHHRALSLGCVRRRTQELRRLPALALHARYVSSRREPLQPRPWPWFAGSFQEPVLPGSRSAIRPRSPLC